MEISEPYSKSTPSAVWEPCIHSVLASFIITPGHDWQEAEVNQLAQSDIRSTDMNLVQAPRLPTELHLPLFLTNTLFLPLKAGLQPDILEECLALK